MSRSFRSFDFDDEMMQHMFDMDAGYKGASTNTARRNRIKRMEELSHSLDDGLNYLGDEYGQAGGGGNGGQSGSRGGARDNTQYNDEEDEDDDDYDNDDYIDDYYYNNNKSFDGRPKSYNEKYSYMYNDYDGPNGRPKQENYRYSLNDPPVGKNLRYQQQSTSQQQQQQQQQQQKQFHSQPSTLRHKNSQGSSGNGTHGSSKHILFNDEDDICYVMDKKQSKSQQLHQQQQQQQQSPPPPIKSKEKEKKKKEPLSPSSLFSSKKKPSKEELRYDVGKSDKSQQVMKAKLKIQNMSNDDSILNMRSNQKQNLLHRHHSVEAKLPSHGADRSQMSPTILEEIEFEMQDVDCEKDDQMEEPIKEKEKSKEKASSKDKDKDKKGSSDSAPSTPTIKKSFRSHLPNHKKLFKVPDIDLNHLKFSCFFSSNKNIALNSSKSATASNTIANKTVSTEAITSKSSENLIEETTPTKVPDSPRKTVKIDLKNEKLERNDSQLSRETYKTHTRTNSGSRTMGSVNNIQSSNENVVDDASVHSSNISDKDFESQAMRVVRTVGQAFEVCHKITMQKKAQENNGDDNSELISELDHCSDIQNLSDFDEPKKILDTTPILQDTPKLQRPNHLDMMTTPSINLLPSPTKVTTPDNENQKENSREYHIVKEQLQQQTQQTKQALAQLILVREQLLTETNARIEAQARTQQLLHQNRELLEHIASLSGLNENDRPGLTSTSLGMAPQSQLPLYLQTLSLLGSTSPSLHGSKSNESPQHNDDYINNNSKSSNSINHNGMQYGGHQQQQQQQQQSFNNMGGSMNPLSPTLNLDNLHIFQNTMQAYNQLNKLSHPQMQQQQHQQQDSNILAQQELYHLNQELLNRLKNLNVTFQPPTPTSSTFSASNNNNNINNNNNYIQENPNSFVFTNTNAQNYLNNNSTNNIMTSSPMGTLNRSSSTYSTISPLDDNMCLSFDRSLDNINNNNDSHFIKPLSQLGNITTLEADGKVKVIVPVQQEQDRRYRNNPNDRNDDFFERGGGGGSYNSLQRPQPQQHRALTPILSRSDKKVTLPGTVTLKVTDESGNVTNQRKLPAQPSFITRSTSEKVPNRSQMMSHVQRTQWARHTTK